MKIGILSAANSSHTVKIVNALAEMNYAVVLFSLADQRDLDSSIDKRVKVIYLRDGGQKGYFTNCLELKKRIKEEKIEILNAHYASGYGTLGAFTGFHPFILSVWGSDVYVFPYLHKYNRLLLCHNLKKADILLSTSHVMAEQTKKFVVNKEIIITPFGVDTKAFYPNPIQKDGIVIGYVKIISSIYGLQYLIKAFANIKCRYPDKKIELHIYGSGVQEQEMIRLADECGISNEVHFFGRIPHADVPKALNSFDIVCLPSETESFGVSAIEAMACAVPCVTSDAEGFCEVMQDGITGYIVPRKNIPELEEKLIALIEDSELREKMGNAGRQRVVENYDFQKNMEIFDEVFQNCIK